MTIVVSELYAALKAAGVEDDQAREAAEAVLSKEATHLATKADIQMLRIEMALLKTELIKRNIGTLIAMTGIFAAIVKLL